MTPSRHRDVRYLALAIALGRPVRAHRHGQHQLLRVDAGALSFTHAAASWVVPTGEAVWLPAGLRHGLDAIERAQISALYIRPRARDRFPEAGPVAMSRLLHELVRTLSRPVEEVRRRRHLEWVVRDELERLEARSFVVALPVDPGARQVALEIVADPSDARPMAELAKAAGLSLRTLQRRFREETGLPLQTWRRRAGLQHATGALVRGESIGEVAHGCGFASASAFIAAFRAELGVTPGAWRRGKRATLT